MMFSNPSPRLRAVVQLQMKLRYPINVPSCPCAIVRIHTTFVICTSKLAEREFKVQSGIGFQFNKAFVIARSHVAGFGIVPTPSKFPVLALHWKGHRPRCKCCVHCGTKLQQCDGIDPMLILVIISTLAMLAMQNCYRDQEL